MTPEEKSLLERTYRISQENNEILRGIRRTNRISMAMRAIYWVVIIVASVGAYYFIEPYIKVLEGSLSGAQSTIDALNGLIMPR